MTFEQMKELLLILLPPLSVLAGVLLTWVLTNKSKRRDFTASAIMQKKIDAYEKLYKLMQTVQAKSHDLFEQSKQTKDKAKIEQLNNQSFTAVLTLAEFCDNNKLYLDEDVVIHICAMCMITAGVIDVDVKDKNYKTKIEDLAVKFSKDFNVGVELLKEYMGIKRLEKSFKKINKPTTKSEIIDYVKELKKKYKR